MRITSVLFVVGLLAAGDAAEASLRISGGAGYSGPDGPYAGNTGDPSWGASFGVAAEAPAGPVRVRLQALWLPTSHRYFRGADAHTVEWLQTAALGRLDVLGVRATRVYAVAGIGASLPLASQRPRKSWRANPRFVPVRTSYDLVGGLGVTMASRPGLFLEGQYSLGLRDVPLDGRRSRRFATTVQLGMEWGH